MYELIAYSTNGVSLSELIHMFGIATCADEKNIVVKEFVKHYEEKLHRINYYGWIDPKTSLENFICLLSVTLHNPDQFIVVALTDDTKAIRFCLTGCGFTEIESFGTYGDEKTALDTLTELCGFQNH